MREQLKLLAELQKIDLQLHESETSLSDLPSKLQSMKDDLLAIEAILEEERGQLADTLAYKNEIGAAQERDRELLKKTNSKLSQVRTSKEYMATQREFDTNRKSSAEREEEVVKLSDAIAAKEASIAEKEKKLDELRKHVEDEAKDTEARLLEIEKVATGQRTERKARSEGVQKGLLRKYDRILKVRNGSAVVPAEDGVCTGCRMQLPPQLYNILQRQETIEQCPNCQRILFFETAEPEAE